jgi:hypothetical protein
MIVGFNAASVAGVILFLIWLPAAISGGFQVWFLLQRRADTSPTVLIKAVIRIMQIVGRAFAIPLSAIGLFLQGWRLDPSLQAIVILLVIGIIAEMLPQFIDDYQSWRYRTGRASAVISVDDQPSDALDPENPQRGGLPPK